MFSSGRCGKDTRHSFGCSATRSRTLLDLDYGAGARISRINKGLRRRKTKTELGFWIDPASGRWGKGQDESDTPDPDVPAPQLVVPFVQDTKNALLIRFAEGQPSLVTSATVQHALLRSLELTFELEEGKLRPSLFLRRRRGVRSCFMKLPKAALAY